MKVLSSLAREHRLFERLLDRLPAAFELPPEQARGEVEKVLLVLLPALEQHDALEALVLDERRAGPSAQARRVLRGLELEHDKLRALRKDVAFIQENAREYPFLLLKTLAARLRDDLAAHFEMEEARVWPLYEGRRLPALDREAAREASELENGMRRRAAAIKDFLRSPR